MKKLRKKIIKNYEKILFTTTTVIINIHITKLHNH